MEDVYNMFTADPNVTDLHIREKSLYKVMFSIDIHQVATPELSVEDARCYVIFFQDGNDYSAYLGLYFLNTGRAIYYPYTANPFHPGVLPAVEEEAHGFIEDMGFMLDEVNIAGLSVEEKNRWIDEQEIFTMRKHPSPAASPGTSVPHQEQSPDRTGMVEGDPSMPSVHQAGQGPGGATFLSGREREAIARLMASF